VKRERDRRLYRLLLCLAPPRLRQRHAREMEAIVIDALETARGRTRRAVAGVWLAAVADLFASRIRHMCRRRSIPRVPQDVERQTIMFGSDLTYTFRWLARQKLSTSLVVAMLTLGIAANVVVFSLVNGLFLRPFALAEPERLVYINETAPKWNLDVVGINYPDFDRWRQEAKLFDGIALWEESSFNLSDGSGAERIDGASVTYDFPAVLGISPLIGRMFDPGEDRPKGPPVVVIGEGLWRDRFNRAPDALGRTLRLNGVNHTIVGVMPAAASFPANIRLWVPLAGNPAQTYQSYGTSGAIGRLKPGVSAADAERDLIRVQQAIWDARDKSHVVSPYAHPLRAEFSRTFRTQAGALLAAVTILLVVACANVASVMLARALLRRREMGIRLAVGASRGRLTRQLFVENLVLSLVGGGFGIVLGVWALRMLIASAGDQVPPWAVFTFDWRVAAFTLAVTIVTTLLFGWAPALHATRGSVKGAMQDVSGGTTAGPSGRRTLSLLVAAEFALAAVLLVCGGLLLRAFDRVQRVDPGFKPDHVLTFSVALPEASYGDESGGKSLAFWTRLTQQLESTPGVEAVGLVNCRPLGCHMGTFYDVEGRAPRAPGDVDPVTLYRPASPGYFRAMGIRLRTGRFFTEEDGRQGSPPVLIVNETFTRTFWPGVVDPVGRRIRGTGRSAPWMTVIGMTADDRHYGLEQPMRPGIYLPLRQSPSTSMAIAVRTVGDPAAFTADAHAVLARLDPDLPMYRIRTMEEEIKRSLSERRLYSWLLGVFALMALTLALGGSYGVTTFLVSQRRREIGIRVALGARTADITQAVLRGSLAAVVIGGVAGIGGSIVVTRLMSGLLFGVSPYDAGVLIAAITVLLAMASVANWLPARRAARLDPMRALRLE
jgi:predicted permease